MRPQKLAPRVCDNCTVELTVAERQASPLLAWCEHCLDEAARRRREPIANPETQE
jgi:hypothetical protein